MARLGPFEPSPCLSVAVSGGADSTALALLARDWAAARGGSALGLVVDHGLRPESGAEAHLALQRLATRGISGRILTLHDLPRGPALAERARVARYRVLAEACAEAEILHLLLGHHAADQAETVLIRELSGSGPDGLAAMAALVETPTLRLLRPLLSFPPVLLREVVRQAGLSWLEDPSNADTTALRPRLRALRRDRAGTGPATWALTAGAALHGLSRVGREHETAQVLSARARFYPEGFAVLSLGTIEPAALAALIRAVGGLIYPPPPAAIAHLAADPRPATLGGVRLMPAGRLGPGLLIAREAAALASPIPARVGAVWDGRFRLAAAPPTPLDSLAFGALGADAAGLRHLSPLPAAVLAGLPAVRRGNSLVAVPHLCYPDRLACDSWRIVLQPPNAAAPASFVAGQPLLRQTEACALHDGSAPPANVS
jgi:tRNA(Ile)-lysidine synthase